MRHGTRVCAILALTTGLVVGCTSADDPQEDAVPTSKAIVTDREPDNPEMTPGQDESPLPIPGEDGAANALSTASEELDGLAFEVDRSDDDGEDLWQVSVAVGQDQVEVYVSLDGKAIVREGETEGLDDEDRRRLDEASVAAGEAAHSAARDTGGAVEEVDLDEEDGTVVWNVELRTTDGASIDVRVDAVSGEVL